MTTADKAKAYDEAIKKAAALYKASEPMSGCNVILETLFPELKESEDERIRKELLVFCRTLATGRTSVLVNNIDFNKWISWLEKQAERKTPQWMIDFLDDYRRKIGCSLDHDEARDVDGKILCIMQWLENQGAQKPEENKGNIGGISPTWSEEDEDMRYKAKAVINRLCAEGKEYVWSIETLKKIFNWLNFLKDRVQPQPKQEWSRDDEQYLLVCKNALAKYQTTDKWDAGIISRWLEDKLKSLRQRKGE